MQIMTRSLVPRRETHGEWRRRGLTQSTMRPGSGLMNDRRRLLTRLVLVLTGVSLTAVALTAYMLSPTAGDDWDRFSEGLRFTVGVTSVIIFAGAALMLRVSEPLLRRLDERAAELARANRELDDFTYIASHDLKEPLRGIRGYCEVLREDHGGNLNDDGQFMVGRLAVLCQRLEQLIDDLLRYSRLGRAPERATVDLNEVLDRVLETLGPAIERRGGQVARIDSLPTVDADATMVGEVLQNLIANGLKFNHSEPPVVEVGCLRAERPTIFVRDNGIGIEQRHHEAIFEMFRRLHGRDRYEGTGAGLCITRKILERHGERIWLESEPGAGSTFYFTLAPASRSATSERQEPALCTAS